MNVHTSHNLFAINRENRHEHSYFFIICLQSIFSVVEIRIELFVVCQKLIHVYA